MVAPTPFFNIGVDFDPLLREVQDVKNRLDPVAKTADLSVLAKTADLSAVAKSSELTPLARSADLNILATKADLTPLAKSCDLTPVAKSSELTPLARTVDLDVLATKQEINELRCLILHLWWLDHGHHYMSEAQPSHVVGLVFEEVGVKDPARREKIKAEEFREAATRRHLRDLLPDNVERLVKDFLAFRTNQPSSPRTGKN